MDLRGKKGVEMMGYIIGITMAIYFIITVLIVLGFRSLFNRASDEIPRKVMEKIAGSRYRIVPNRAYRNKKYREKRDRLICKKFLSGSKPGELAEEYGLSRRRIRQILYSIAG